MRARHNLAGKRYGRWTALTLVEGPGQSRWNCRCECGVEKIVYATSLISGQTLSCGCYRDAENTKRNTVHGKAKQKVNNAWHGIKARTSNPSCKEYKWYGARGIKMCPEWMSSFVRFYAYVGDPPSDKHSIDRIDNAGDYQPGNVLWATMEEQANNTRRNNLITALGKTQTAAQWAKETGINAATIAQRISRLKWTADEAVTRPSSPLSRKVFAFGAALGVQFSTKEQV